jgi:RND superfamily putative drug exporter
VSSVGVLVLLTLPVLDIRLGFADAGTDAPESTSRRAYDLLSAGFGPGSNGPLVVVAEGDAGPDRVMGALAAADGGGEAVIPVGESPTTVLVTPEGGPAARSTTDLVHRLRDDVLPELSRRPAARISSVARRRRRSTSPTP